MDYSLHKNGDRSSNGIVFLPEKDNLEGKRDLDARQIVVLVLGVYGCLCLFLSFFNIEYNKVAIFISPLVYSALLVAIFLFRRKRYVFILILIGLWAIGGYLFKEPLLIGLKMVFNQCAVAANGVTETGINLLDVADTANSVIFTTAVLVYGLLPVSLLLSYATLYRYNIFIPLLLTLPVIEVGIYFKLTPRIVPFAVAIAYTIAVIVMYKLSQKPARIKKTSFFDMRNNSELKKTSGSMGLMAALLLGFSLIAFGILIPEQLYNRYIENSSILVKVNQVFDKDFWLELLIEDKIEIHGGITGGNISQAGEYVFTGDTDLIVTAESLQNSIYLIGYIGSDYTGNSWGSLSKKETADYEAIQSAAKVSQWELCCQILDINAKLLSPVFNAEKRTITVENINAPDEYAYVPYNAVFSDELEISADGQAELKGTEYETQYYDIVNYNNNIFTNDYENLKSDLYGSLGNSAEVTTSELDDYFIIEKAYSAFVHEVYTALPGNLSEQFVEDFENIDYANTESLIKYVTGKLSNLAAYTLAPGELPAGKDFVEYFLYENKAGYCTHFATAATLAFRLSGIPARYVEGYVINVADYTNAQSENGRYSMEIKDSDSHAWVELYLDGFGWVPVEVTPGFTELVVGDDALGGTLSEYEIGSGSELNDIDIEKPEISQEDSGTAEPDQAAENDEAIAETDSKSHLLFVLCLGILLVVLLVAGLIIRRKILLFKLAKLAEDSGIDSSTLVLYSHVVDVLKLAGIDRAAYYSDLEYANDAGKLECVPAEKMYNASAIALKAALGPDGVGDQERDEVTQLLKELIENIYSEGNWVLKLKRKRQSGLYIAKSVCQLYNKTRIG